MPQTVIIVISRELFDVAGEDIQAAVSGRAAAHGYSETVVSVAPLTEQPADDAPPTE